MKKEKLDFFLASRSIGWNKRILKMDSNELLPGLHLLKNKLKTWSNLSTYNQQGVYAEKGYGCFSFSRIREKN